MTNKFRLLGLGFALVLGSCTQDNTVEEMETMFKGLPQAPLAQADSTHTAMVRPEDRVFDKTLFLNDSTGTYFSDFIEDSDVVNTPEFRIIAPVGLPEHNVTIVSKEDGHPVKDGDRSIRINWAPGDAGEWPNGGWKDADNMRGRSEIGDRNLLKFEENTSIGWSYSMFLPETKSINPAHNTQTVIFQVYHHTDNWLKPLMFLWANADGSISFRDHDDVAFDNKVVEDKVVIPARDVYNKWHDIDVRVDFVDVDNAKVTITIDGNVVVEKYRDMANDGDGRLDYEFRTGFYNGWYLVGEEGVNLFEEQLMYVDNVMKKDNTYFVNN